MANKKQQIFAKIVLHNKLLDAAEVERLLKEFVDPEKVVRQLIETEKIAEKKRPAIAGTVPQTGSKVDAHSLRPGGGHIKRILQPIDQTE